MGEADLFEIISSGALDRFVRRRFVRRRFVRKRFRRRIFRKSEADLTGGMGQVTGKNERTLISLHPLPPEQEG
ncbi:MAG: hypothetical protein E7L01_19495 [Paenibacillus macerans]|uniref:Uncharacterized protein n=1 Tax=Paenibacillus macerans TaxID=44252 RepID=A0A6N8F1I9_PAEMA|nr:hypothetical protein [Paenibacillus macerans]MBS5912978.1 hypothetical protein [Paenibacillus macerans]MCY7558593.1 hypothetical protein [Paenibacillus macerans]MDU7475496.1 hypothetical protein [Paenibacillus macerans]MEC0152810.1 hypothetical protein [Paenibacillus macerans]MEC0330922.1 hypothetical protein [Paenibacillus macerans]